MAIAKLRPEEQVGLGLAILVHVALVAVLVLQPARREHFPVPERIAVSLADDVGMTSAAPEIAAEGQAATAPEVSDTVAPPPAPPVEQPPPPQPPKRPPPRLARAQPTEPPPPPPKRPPPPRPQQDSATGSRFADAFSEGQGANEAPALVPASQIGASAKASLKQAIDRQLRKYWTPPSGADADQLRTYLTFDLNPDGSLKGRPRLVRQTGVNDTNRPQAGRHVELAIRAVELAAPFNLPPEYYNAWKHITDWEFKWTPQQ